MGEFRSHDGVGRLAASSAGQDRSEIFRAVLAQGVAALARQHADLPTDCPIIISGMASSSICWRELPYAPLPFAPDGSDMVWQDAGPLSASGRSHRVVLLSGVRSEWEIMRGEEIQVLGLTRWSAALAMNEAVLVLPGTHPSTSMSKAAASLTFRLT